MASCNCPCEEWGCPTCCYCNRDFSDTNSTALKSESVGDDEAALTFLKDHYGINQNQELEDPDGVSFFLAGCHHARAQSQADIQKLTGERDRYKNALERIESTALRTIAAKSDLYHELKLNCQIAREALARVTEILGEGK